MSDTKFHFSNPAQLNPRVHVGQNQILQAIDLITHTHNTHMNSLMYTKTPLFGTAQFKKKNKVYKKLHGTVVT